MWQGININDGLTQAIMGVGRTLFTDIGAVLLGWALIHFLKNLGLALLGKEIKTGTGSKRFVTYAIEATLGLMVIGSILSGGFINFLNGLYNYASHLSSQITF